MASSFGRIMFSTAAKALQEKFGSRASYKRMEERAIFNGISGFESDFIAQRDSFYMASIGENGYPYIQHRGGPKGFLKVVDDHTLAFPDFSGNRQYISVGNLATNRNVSLILVDYPAQARLKLLAKAEAVETGKRPELMELFTLDKYPARIERIIVLHVEAMDWNCPQHITPRYTESEINEALVPQREYIAQMEAELEKLKPKP